MKPNKQFELTVHDIEIIETALLKRLNNLFNERLTHVESTITPEADLEVVKQIDQQMADVNDLLGRLYNQKNFYRPDGVYVSG